MMEIFSNPTFVLFAVLALGMALGRISVGGVSLGSSGVLFVALLAGHLGLRVPEGVTGIGTALFVYCVGLGVGNRFFASLRSRGSRLVLLALPVVGMSWLLCRVGCSLLGIDPAVGAGIFAGACTSTPGLAAAMEALQSSGGNTAGLNIGYGVAYPMGVVGVVLFVQLLPRLLRRSLDGAPEASGEDPEQIITGLVRVCHPQLMGRGVVEFMESGAMGCRITRVLREGRLVPVTAEDVLTPQTELLLVGTREQMRRDVTLLGEADAEPLPRSADERAEVILLEPELSNRTLRALDTPGHDGVIVSRITRLGHTFIPTADTELIRNDVLTVVGEPEAIARFRQRCRHRSSAIGMADILSLTAGVALGIWVGSISLGGGPNSEGFSLGMAGGPLVVALVLGHFGHVGPIAGYMPRASRMLLLELALMLFLAGAGVSGGASLVETLRAQGLPMLLLGALTTLAPLPVGYWVARRLLGLSLSEALGGICGSMTSTPALGAITAKTEHQSPVIAYATAYPAALILMTLLAKLFVSMT